MLAWGFLYIRRADTPLYGGIVLLAGLIVVCTELILEEIKSLKDDIKDKKEGC